MQTTYQRQGDIAVIALDHPPVNSFSLTLRRDLLQALAEIERDATLAALVITGTGRVFSGGADISEFEAGLALAEPNLLQIHQRLEDYPKPVIAALNGAALGGGCEFALTCHYRVGGPKSSIGLPEVNLGILPAAGGTQRLPRLIGAPLALQMILDGKPRPADVMAGAGYFDRMATGDVTAAAIELAREVIRSGGARPRLRDRQVDTSGLEGGAEGFLRHAAARLSQRTPKLPAPEACLRAVEAALRLPFDEGLELEQRLFAELVTSTESKALRHAFFAERQASKIEGLAPGTKPRPIRNAGVVGAGLMGSGIALALLNAGIPVTLLDTGRDPLDRGLGRIHASLKQAVDKGRISDEQRQQRLQALTPTLDLQALSDADIIIEAVFEDRPLKQQVFRQLDRVARPGTILASNTSMLDLDSIALETSRPADVIGTHFFSPAHVMRLLEVVRTAHTADDVLATTMQLARTLGKVGVVARVCDGFIGNRMVEQYLRQAGLLVEEGALPQQVDTALESWGMAMGPFRMLDMAGIDVNMLVRRRRYVEMPELRYSKWLDRVHDLGRHGQKTGAGIYDYSEDGRTPRVDSCIEKLIRDYRREHGVTPRAIEEQEIVDRCILALVNEGALLLDEGIAQRAGDIDVVYLTGYGFPAWRGGPMFHADTLGIDHVVAVIRELGTAPDADTAFWQPAPRLLQLARSGQGFFPHRN